MTVGVIALPSYDYGYIVDGKWYLVNGSWVVR